MGKLRELLQTDRRPEAWQGTFEAYYEMVLANPRLARGAHALLYDAILAAGVEDGRYSVFADSIFGIDDVLQQIVQVFHASAMGLDIRRRILLLVGPPGGGKSTVVTLLKRRLEEYTQTEEGAVYAIAGCPMHEDPLHLLPRHMRVLPSGATVEGDLCPACQWRLEHEWGGDILSVPVERIVYSEQSRVGIATFAPSDPNTQDVSDLVGSMDFVALQRYGTESHPLAYRFDGTLNVANRGIAELIEFLKAKPELQYTFLTLAQERQIKTGRFALISADEVVMAHTNESEYQRFTADKRNEALQNRTYIVRVPYNLRWRDEEKIYQKLLGESQVKAHVAPWTLKAAAAWALLSRYERHEKYDPLTKLKLYDGQYEGEYRPQHAEEAREESPRDGMQGVSPRQVINALSQAAASSKVACLTPVDALRALLDSLQHHVAGESKEERERLEAAVAMVRKEYDTWIVETISKAFLGAFEDAAQSLLKRYLDTAEAAIRKDKVKDPITGERRDPDEKFLQSIENLIAVNAQGRAAFREEILVRVAGMLRRGEEFRWDSHPRLKEAIEKRMFADLQGTIRTTVSTKLPDEEQLKRLDAVKARLIEEYGFCDHCSSQALDYVGYLLERS